MRYYENRQLEMLIGMAQALKKQHGVLSAKVPALKNIISEFAGKMEALHKLKILNPNTVAIGTSQKKTAKEAFADTIFLLLSALKAGNDSKRSQAEEALFKLTLADLKKLTADQMAKTGLKIIQLAKKIKNPRYYGLSAEDIKDAQAYYKEYSAIKHLPTERRKERADRRNRLTAGIKEGIIMLKTKIDPLMVIATKDDSKLREDYKNSRRIMSPPFGRPTDSEVRYRKSRKKKKN